MAVTTDEILEIIETEKTNISVFLTTAQLLVDEELILSNLSSSRLDLITKYLAAHFIYISDKDQQISGENFGSYSYSTTKNLGQNLSSSLFGQQAILLDSTNTLKSLNDSTDTTTNKITFQAL